MKEEIQKIIEFCFEHSTARAFLVFSGILVIFSMGYAKEFISIAFFTLFYAFIAYRIVVLRKAEVWGDYAAGDSLGALLYFVIDWLLFVSWIIGTLILLSVVPSIDLLNTYQSTYLFGFLSVLGIALATLISWIVLIFWRAIRQEREKSKKSNTNG